jgi:small subunit ribosomal protein S5
MRQQNQHGQRNTGDNTQPEFEEKVIMINRVSKKTKGGNNMGFSALMVVGDRKGKVGLGLGKAKDVQSAIRKGVKKAKKKMLSVPLDGTTVPFSVSVKLGAGKVLLKPAPKGSGIIAGGPVRAVVEAAGIRDISSKILGSSNQAASVYATFEALKQIQALVNLKGIKLKSEADVEAEEEAKHKALEEKAKKAHSEAAAAKKPTTDKVDKKVAAKPDAKKPVAKPSAAPAKKTAKKTTK